MKFVKEVTGEKMAIPAAALKLCGFENGDKAELHALPSAAIILKQKMTAMEVIQAMDALHQLTVDLSVHLARASGPCDGCDGDYPFDGLDGQEIALPDYLRDEAGIPENAKLCAYVDEEENTVTIAEAGYDHDLRDVPPYLLEMLAASGICIGELEERLMLEDTVYGV